ncbi:MAG: ribbon-helix-helix protein, CopG family [Armatimonadota bacterium]
MSRLNAPVRKITISLPAELVEFADRMAGQSRLSRSQVISRALAQIRAGEEERLAAEGYRFYAQEAEEFAAASSRAVAEAVDHAG